MRGLKSTPNASRRNLLRGKPMEAKPPMRLPWVIDETAFLEGCTRCGDCLPACDAGILVLGDGGFVHADFTLGECTFCHDCVDACSEPLFRETTEPPWFTLLNIKDNCLAKNNIVCQSCKDVCEPQAIEFRYDSAIPTPTPNQSLCTTCGACVSACPSQSIELIPSSEPNHVR